MVPGGDGLDLAGACAKPHPQCRSHHLPHRSRCRERSRPRPRDGRRRLHYQAIRQQELVAREACAVLRRFERPSTPSIIRQGTTEIDAGAMQLRVAGELVTTATEFRLPGFARHPYRVFSRDHLLDAVWGDSASSPRARSTSTSAASGKKIEADPETPRYLRTMRGGRYRFEIPKTSQPAQVEPADSGKGIAGDSTQAVQ